MKTSQFSFPAQGSFGRLKPACIHRAHALLENLRPGYHEVALNLPGRRRRPRSLY
jgi:hypothetical protein